MQIITKNSNENGSYPPIQSWESVQVPDDYAVISCNTDVFYTYNGFVNLEIAENNVIGMSPNVDAWIAWKAEKNAQPKPKPSIESRNRADIDYLAMISGVNLDA